MRCKKEIVEVIIEKERTFLSSINRSLPANSYKMQYYNDVKDNLWRGKYNDLEEIDYPHLRLDYSKASGGELKDSKTPAKMKSIRSSSAMTYNLLGNESIVSYPGNKLKASGIYEIEYEKQLLTLKNNPQPANLDAFLYNEKKEEAFFCEMKMLEWLTSTPGFLKAEYEKTEKYFIESSEDENTVATFMKVIRMLKNVMPTYRVVPEGEVHHFSQYDAWQMFKHMLGIYTMTSKLASNQIEEIVKKSAKGKLSTLPSLQKATLVNVVFEPPASIFESEKLRNAYTEALKTEHREFDIFMNIIKESGVIDVFKKDCGIDFDIVYMSTAEFMDCFDLAGRKDYLERYRLDYV